MKLRSLTKTTTLLSFGIFFFTYIATQKSIVIEQSKEITADFYNIEFLRNSPAVQKVLEQKGFIEIDIITQDNLKINTTILDQHQEKDIQATLISMPGFVPGNKEGMTTLYAMLEDQPYNFMFIDSRGHGKSDGELLTFNGIKEYGKHQYLDIVAAVQYIAEYNKKHNIKSDIILHGLCSGAFHTIKAVHYLQQNNPEAYRCIKGIVLDSGWPSIVAIAETVLAAEAASRCKTYNMPFLEWPVAGMLKATYRLFFKKEHKKQTPITYHIQSIEQPIFFIHAENDTFVSAHHTHQLAAQSQKPTIWLVKDCDHVNNHIKYKDEYAEKLNNFIKLALA
ncbi:MAG: alpha/beta hydrolase [Candidatus Chromulinivorax sp.]